MVKEHIKNFIFLSRSPVQNILRVLMILVSIFTIATTIYYHGFEHSLRTRQILLASNKFFFAVFIINYIIKLFISQDYRGFLKQTWLEALLLIFIIYDVISYYVFQFPILKRIFGYLNIDTFSPKYAFFIQFFLILLVVIEFVKSARDLGKIPLKPPVLFIFSFIILIFGGAGLLSLPAITTTGESMRFIDAVFTSASASCVTGLIVVDTATFFNSKGHLIILGLIQLGGLGIITFATYFAMFYKKGVGIKHQYALQQILDSESLLGSYGLIRKIFLYTIFIELVGAIAIFSLWGNYQFDSFQQKLFSSVFHAISAFCNAGFSLFTYNLMEPGIHDKYLLHLVVAVLIFFGSLGFPAMRDIFEINNLRTRMKMRWKKWKPSTQIAFYSSIALVIIGAVAFYLLEKNNTIKDMDSFPAIVTSIFQSVVTRTAGFNTVDFAKLGAPILVIFIGLMFIGASSGSTGGGIKTSTFVVIFASIWATLRGRKIITMARRTLSHELAYKAFTVFVFAASFIFISTFILSITDPQFPILNLLFEEVSAFATVGLSTGITAGLSDAAKIILIVTMFVGRVGILTLAFALSSEVQSDAYKYPNSHIMIG